MPTLEDRVKILETDVTDLKTRVEVTEDETHSIADLIKVEHRCTNTRFDWLDRQMMGIGRRMGVIEGKVDARPPVLAEMLKSLQNDIRRRLVA